MLAFTWPLHGRIKIVTLRNLKLLRPITLVSPKYFTYLLKQKKENIINIYHVVNTVR